MHHCLLLWWMTISRLLVVHLVTKLIICGNAKARMGAGDPEPDPSASESVNFLDLFDIVAGATCYLTAFFFRRDAVGQPFLQ